MYMWRLYVCVYGRFLLDGRVILQRRKQLYTATEIELLSLNVHMV